MKQVSVIGSGTAEEKEEIYLVAEKLGEVLGSHGCIVICGGMWGVMEAVCKGAKRKGGTTVGILPTDSLKDGNQYLDIKIPTGIGEARNALVVKSGRFVVAVGGGFGTLSEIGHALKGHKKVVGFKTWRIEGVENYESPERFLKRVEELVRKL